MIIRLFSIFDPSRNWFMLNNWMIIFILVKFSPSKLYSTYNNLTFFCKLVIFLNQEAFLSLKNNFNSLFYISLFFIIFTANFQGLLSYVIAPISHMSVTLSLSLIIWTGIIAYGLFFHLSNFLSHLVPFGCPNRLMFFIVLIESIRICIRPITLSVRLAANIMAGHVILTLISSSSLLRTPRFVVRTLIQRIMLILEIGVAIVQPYVFFTLLCLYKSEIN